MLAAGQSTQVTQKYQQSILPVLPHTRQLNRLPIEAEQGYIASHII